MMYCWRCPTRAFDLGEMSKKLLDKMSQRVEA